MWSTVGKKSIESQVDAMKILTRQIDLATQERKPIVMMGDMNISFLFRINNSLSCWNLNPGHPGTKQIAYQCATVLR